MTAYFRPTTLDEALAIRAGRDVEIIAGGTDVYCYLKHEDSATGPRDAAIVQRMAEG